MSKLSELIDQLCPEGVEYKSIGSLITRVTERGKDDTSVQQVYVVSNTQGLVRAEDYRENTIHSEDTSNYTIVRKNMMAYNPSRLNIGSIAMLKNDTDGLVSPMYVVFSIDNSKVLYEFFEYVVKSPAIANKISSFKEEGARFRFDFSRWNWIDIPVPPLPIQEEIVRMLDVFVQYSNELTAELTARKKQYEYYRDELLKQESVPRMKLSEIATVFRGEYITKKNSHVGNVPVILGGQEPAYFIDRFNHKGEIVAIARSGASAGFVSYWNEPIFITDGFGYEAKTGVSIPKYLYYVLKNMESDLNAMKRGAGVPHVSGEVLGNLELPVPTIAEQKRIVDILDRFDALCNDISAGLPAEIEARQKQYEYYRDKLLTFESAK